MPAGEVVMCASKVNVTYALTYEQADDLMALHAESEPELSQLSQLTDQLLAWRKVPVTHVTHATRTPCPAPEG
jgi:hypothetical protein